MRADRDMTELNIPFRRWKNHPQTGTDFPDTAPAATEGDIFAAVVDALAQQLPEDIELVAGIDIGGYGFASAVAYRRRIGVLDVRKVANINPELMRTLATNYETGDGLCISRYNRLLGRKVAVLDDCLMSGSTALAGVRLLRRLGAECTTALFVFALDGMNGCRLLENDDVSVHILQILPRSGNNGHATV
ncbi:MAG: phosphoribosyltransferase family protein [Bosea sp. (in: a-proteobacteria)]